MDQNGYDYVIRRTCIYFISLLKEGHNLFQFQNILLPSSYKKNPELQTNTADTLK